MLDIPDLNFDTRLVHVQHAKGGQPRFVPFSQTTTATLLDYLYDARPKQAYRNNLNPSFLLNKFGQRMAGATLHRRLKHMQASSDDDTLKAVCVRPHILRHSIATHLLYGGMSLEKVAQFLGHRSLASTQLYTHLLSDSINRA